MSKVFVVTKANPLEPEIYVTVKATAKEAEKYIRGIFPNARKDQPFGGKTSFLCRKDGADSLMFIREEELG